MHKGMYAQEHRKFARSKGVTLIFSKPSFSDGSFFSSFFWWWWGTLWLLFLHVNHWGSLDGGHPRDYTGVLRAPDTSWEVR